MDPGFRRMTPLEVAPFHERADDAAQRLDLAARPVGLGEDGADRVPGRRRAVGRMEIIGGGERLVELPDQPFEMRVRRARLGFGSPSVGTASAPCFDHS